MGDLKRGWAAHSRPRVARLMYVKGQLDGMAGHLWDLSFGSGAFPLEYCGVRNLVFRTYVASAQNHDDGLGFNDRTTYGTYKAWAEQGYGTSSAHHSLRVRR